GASRASARSSGRASTRSSGRPSSSSLFGSPRVSSGRGACGRSLRVVVDAAAALPAQASRCDVLLDQRAGAELLPQRAVEKTQDREARIETDQVDQLERAHWVVESELERLVD